MQTFCNQPGNLIQQSPRDRITMPVNRILDEVLQDFDDRCCYVAVIACQG